LTNRINYPKCDVTTTLSGLSAPVSSGFFMPHFRVPNRLYGGSRGPNITPPGNKPRRLSAVVETRHSHLAKQLITKEATS